jgi:hypothetical protein
MSSQRMQGKARLAVWVAAVAGLLPAGVVSAQQPFPRPATEWYRDDPATAPAQPVAPIAPAPVPPPAQAPAVDPQLGAAAGQRLPAADAAARRPYLMPMPQNPYAGYGSSSGMYPSYEMNSYVSASARAATARALFRQAESELSNAYRAAQRQFEQSLDYRQALKDERDAWENLNNARIRAISTIADDSKYKRLIALRDDLAQQLEQNRNRKTLNAEEIMAMASLKMSYSTEIRAMEVTAMGNDSAVGEARKRLVEAGAKVSAMRLGYENAVRENTDILIARRNLEDARVARLTAEAYLRAATTNSAYALDYAYYLYRRPSPYGGGWDYAGFGGIR